MRFIKVIAPVFLVPLLLTACSKSKEDSPVAKIKDRTISVATYEATWFKVDPKFLPETDDLEGRLEFLDTMIDKDVLALKADELGYDKDEYVVKGMEAFKKVGLQAGYLKLKVADKIDVSEKNLREYYKNYGVTYHVKQILVDTHDEAEQVYDILADGADFETVCREYSKGPDAEEGGRIVNALYGTFPPDFHNELFSKKVGEITRPIESPYGYFVIKVVSENRPAQRPFDEVRADIEQLVTNQQQIQLTNEMAADVRRRAGFEWYEDNLKTAFVYLPADRPLTSPPNRDDEIYPLLRIEPQDLDKPLVGYKGKFITMKDFSDLYDRASFFRRPRRERRLGDVKHFLLEIVMNELVEDEMAQSGIENEPEVAELLSRKREQLMVDKLYQDLIDKQTIVGPAEIESYYQDNMEQFRRNEERRFGFILTGDRGAAEEAYSLLRDDVPFERVAEQYNVEDLRQGLATDRFILKGENPDIDEHGFALARVGEFSKPFETDRGWMVLKLYERKPERILTVAEAQADIGRYLKTLKNEERLNELLVKWREEYPIEIYEKNLMKADLESRPTRGVRFS